LRRSEVLEHGEMSPLAQHALQLRGHSNAAAHHHDIDVVVVCIAAEVVPTSTTGYSLSPNVGRPPPLHEASSSVEAAKNINFFISILIVYYLNLYINFIILRKLTATP